MAVGVKRFVDRVDPEFVRRVGKHPVPWGPLGYVTFKRTYSRLREDLGRTEEWIDTTERWVNAILSYGGQFSRTEVETLFEYAYNLKISPPGRMLWQLGTETIEKVGGDSANNCWSTAVDSIESFCFAFDELMLGGGVGFSILPSHVYKLPTVRGGVGVKRRDGNDADFIVPDNREGWVELLRRTLKAYFETGRGFTYSVHCVRSKGERIKGFGGVASGPGDLVKGIGQISAVLDARGGKALRPIDALDIMNIIGSVVVSGNVRRSAQLALGSSDDIEFLTAKTWSKGVPNWRAMSNNSVARDKFEGLPAEFWSGYAGEGEPYGLVNLGLMRSHGRLRDGKDYRPDYKAVAPNPCTSGCTNVLTSLGYRRIDSLVGQEVEVWNGEEWATVTPRVTGTDRELFRVCLSDGRSLDCTANHTWLLAPDERRVQTANLKVGDVLHPFLVPRDPNDKWRWVTGGEVGKVTAIIPLGVADKVYCFTEPKTNRGTFNGIVTGQCAEQSLEDGECCDLFELFLSRFRDVKEFVTGGKLAYKVCKTVLQLPYSWPKTQEVVKRNQRMGISVSGFCQSAFSADDYDTVYRAVEETDRRYSKRIGANTSIKLTTVKPSGCRPWFALTTTNAGVLTLDEIMRSHPENQEWAKVEGVRAVRPDGEKEVSQSFDNGVSDLVRVNLTYGVELLSTPQHPWFVSNTYAHNRTPRSTPVGEFVEAANLKEGDVIEIAVGLYRNDVPAPLRSVNLRSVKMRADSNPIFQPTTMTADLAWLFGYLWGDGAQSPGQWRIRFSDERRENIDKAARIIHESFGIEAVASQEGRTDWSLTAASIQLWHWLIGQGVWKYYDDRDGTLDVIPEVVRRSTREHVIAFVAGILDADGGCYVVNGGKVSPRITNSQRRFTDHLQHVMWAVGLPCGRSWARGSEGHFGDGCYHMTIAPALCNADALIDLERHSTKVTKCREENPDAVFGDKVTMTPGRVLSVEPGGRMRTYDVEVPDGNYYYNGAFKSHNTVSLLPGVTPGVHPAYSRYYIRRIRFSSNDPIVGACRDAGYPVEFQYGFDGAADTDTSVVSFPVDVGPDTLTASEVTAIDQLEKQKFLQTHWSDNNVSVTVYYRNEELPGIKEWLKENYETSVKTTSFLRHSDHGFRQAPYEEIDRGKYEELASSCKPLTAITDARQWDTVDSLECVGGVCPVK